MVEGFVAGGHPRGRGALCFAGMPHPPLPPPASAPRPAGLRRALKWTGITLAVLVGLPLLLLLVLLLVNWRDEPLSATARALRVPPPNPYAAADNIYLWLAGFDAPAGEPVVAAGAARIARADAQATALLGAPAADLSPAGALRFRGEADWCQPLEASCWSSGPRDTQIAALAADNAELLGRYRALFVLQGYYDTSKPTYATAPVWGTVSAVRHLVLAQLVAGLRAAQPAARERALAGLESDLRLWHRVLAGEGDILAKMLALAYLQGDELLLADCLADAHGTPPPGATAAAPLFPLADFDLGGAFAREYRAQERTLEALKRQAAPGGTGLEPGPGARWNPAARLLDWYSFHMFQLDATLNLFARHDAELIALAAISPGNSARLAGLERAVQPAPLAYLGYNPVGRVLASLWPAALRDYLRRAADGAALQRLVKAAAEIRAQGIAPAQVPQFLTRHPEWSTHPADGHAFLYDRAAGTLALLPLASYPRERRFTVPLYAAEEPGGLALPRKGR